MRKLVCILPLIIVIASCNNRSDSLDYEIPFEGHKPIIELALISNHQPKVNISFTEDVLANTIQEYDLVIDHTINLCNLSANLCEQFDVLSLIAPIEIEAHQDYFINGTINIDDKVFAVKSDIVKIPNLVEIVDSKVDTSSLNSNVKITFSFFDPPNEKNYYRVQIIKQNQSKVVKNHSLRIWDDEGFDGELYEFEFNGLRFAPNAINDSSQPFIGVDKIIILLHNVTYEYFNYYTSISQSQSTSNMGNQYSTLQPVWSNLTGGYGIVYGSSIDSLVIDL